MKASTIGSALKRGIAVAVLVLCGVWAFRSLDMGDLMAVFATSDWRPIALAGLINLTLGTWACIQRLWVLLRRLPSIRALRYSEMVSIYLASTAAHNMLPAPGGEVLRTVYLARRYGYALGEVVAVQVLDKIVDAATLAIEIAVLALAVGLPAALGQALRLALVVVAAALLGLFIAVRLNHGGQGKGFVGRLRELLTEVGQGFNHMRSPRTLAASFCWSVLADAANAATVAMVLAGLGVSLDAGAWFACVATARLSGVIPATPGQVGIQEAGLVVVLAHYSVAAPVALGFALLYRVAHLVPVTLVGLWELRRYQPRELVSPGGRIK